MSGNINMDHLKELTERADARLDAVELDNKNQVDSFTLGPSGVNQLYYTVFARTANTNATGNCGATLLVTDCGNFGGTLAGAWLVQLSNRGSKATMSVTTLQPHNSGTVEFGYYEADGYFYFGLYTSAYRANCAVTVLRNTGVTLQDFGDATAAPDGWTAVTPRVVSVESPPQAFTLAADGWVEDTSVAAYPYRYDLAVIGVTAAHRVDAVLDAASVAISAESRLCPVTETASEKVVFRSHLVPAALSGHIYISQGGIGS